MDRDAEEAANANDAVEVYVEVDVPVAAPIAVLIIGIPAAGKSTVAEHLARRLSRSAHVSGDTLGHMVVSGHEYPQPPRPGEDHDHEGRRQLFLRARNAAILANSFARAGFVPLIDDVVTRRAHLDYYIDHLETELAVVVLAPSVDVVLARDSGRAKRGIGEMWLFLEETMRDELSTVGHWIDSSLHTPEETVDEILRYLGNDLGVDLALAPD